jgi:glycosyltransferase involved in cell wall biosynthesis
MGQQLWSSRARFRCRTCRDPIIPCFAVCYVRTNVGCLTCLSRAAGKALRTDCRRDGVRHIRNLTIFIKRLVGGKGELGLTSSWHPEGPDYGTWAELLSLSPTIVHTFPLPGLPLGAASVLGPLLRRHRAHFLIMSPWSLEGPGQSARLGRATTDYLRDHPKHRLIFLGNTSSETDLLQKESCTATTINQNCLFNEEIFKPLPDIEPVYDAVYNARFARWKRHELAGDIRKLALIYFRHYGEQSAEQFHAEHARLAAILPNAHFANELTPDGCEWIGARQVNRILSQSRVGLCLSEIEGTMRASIEYLMAGLSVVSTPSLGGRDFYFDDEFCIVCAPDARSVREATEAMIARNVPRDYVRAKTLAKINQQRGLYISLVQSLIDQARGRLRFEDRFMELTRGETIMRWGSMKEFSERIAWLVRNNPMRFGSAWDAKYAANRSEGQTEASL